MKTIYVTTPDNIKVEYRLAGAGSRCGAAVIDTAIQVLLFIVVLIAAFFSVYNFSTSLFYSEMERLGNVVAFVLIAYFAIFLGYFLICEIIMKGQTIGKRIFGLRTIRSNGQPITFIHSIIRNIIRVMIDNYGVGIVTMLFSKNCKRLGDMLSNTIVISENPGKFSAKALVFDLLQNTTEITSDGDYSITTEENEILKDYFARKDNFIDNGNYSKVRIYNYFADKYNINSTNINDNFLYEIMNNYAGF